ncbi:hypothetical protein FOVG_05737 [Fusarium oxysporum f. sp. pisi HDV247]|uniref:Uncharacterized protein n=2 Tax=Fusarium oxysporum TaxID=5507 RepID=X0LF93_FUSOX|nr:hypothetical protein FOVG_05737 [Fusarium oxysporum f. sp. pisi HDV247]EXM19716.1 hypothetical protein FOTG_12352 [Fusarium oxysporum f. sp. vasinfectum 25433]
MSGVTSFSIRRGGYRSLAQSEDVLGCFTWARRVHVS